MAALLEVVGNDMKVVGATSENAMHCTSKGRFTARSELLKVLFLVLSVCGFLYLYQISRKRLNGFAPNSHGRRA